MKTKKNIMMYDFFLLINSIAPKYSKVRVDGDVCVRFYAHRSFVFTMMEVSAVLIYKIIYTLTA